MWDRIREQPLTRYNGHAAKCNRFARKTGTLPYFTNRLASHFPEFDFLPICEIGYVPVFCKQHVHTCAVFA